MVSAKYNAIKPWKGKIPPFPGQRVEKSTVASCSQFTQRQQVTRAISLQPVGKDILISATI